MRSFILLVAALSICSAFVVQPVVSRRLSSSALRSSSPIAAAKKPTGPVKFSGFASAEEERRQKLEVGTNWPPRTSTIAGEGYQFFQGPTPKTGVQEDLPSFFSFNDVGGISTVQAAFVGVAAVGSLALAAFVFSA